MKNRYLIALLTISAMLYGCSTSNKIGPLKPEPSKNTPVAYETTTSFINLPVTISIADMETQVNKYLTGLIYEDNDINDDEIAMKVWKTSPIKFTEKDGKLQSVVPIKVLAKVKYGTSAFGVDMYDTREFNLDAVVTFTSTVGLNNWNMTTNTSIENLKWTESPSVTIAGRKVAITYLINPGIKLFKSKIETKLDESLAKVADFKPQVLEALEQLSTPFLTSEQYQAWFKLNPLELYVTDAVLSKNKITMDMGLKCTMQTVVGQKPASNFKKENIILKPVNKMPEKITAVVAAVSTYESASKVITRNFQGQEFGDGKRKVTVQKVDLWHKDGKMIVALEMTGSINGTIYLSGYPGYNSATKEIFFDKLDYVLDTKSVLMKTANWLAGGVILKKMQESCRYSIQPNLEEGKNNMLPYLQNYSPMPGVFINGTIGDFEFEKIQLTDNAIIAFIKTSGKMNVKIDGLK